MSTINANDDEKLQFCALQVNLTNFIVDFHEEKTYACFSQAMSALLCCGSCFDAHNLGEDGITYSWLDSLLTSTDDKVKMICNCKC